MATYKVETVHVGFPYPCLEAVGHLGRGAYE